MLERRAGARDINLLPLMRSLPPQDILIIFPPQSDKQHFLGHNGDGWWVYEQPWGEGVGGGHPSFILSRPPTEKRLKTNIANKEKKRWRRWGCCGRGRGVNGDGGRQMSRSDVPSLDTSSLENPLDHPPHLNGRHTESCSCFNINSASTPASDRFTSHLARLQWNLLTKQLKSD